MSDYTPTTEEVREAYGEQTNFRRHASQTYTQVFEEEDGEFDRWLAEVIKAERERIRVNIIDRVQDLSSCNKVDNCQEFGALISSYIEEWIDEETE